MASLPAQRHGLPRPPVLKLPALHAGGDVGQARFNLDVHRFLEQVLRDPWLLGVEITLGSLPAGINKVRHTLGRKPRGLVVTRVTGNAVLWEGQEADENYLYLEASTPSANFVIRVY